MHSLDKVIHVHIHIHYANSTKFALCQAVYTLLVNQQLYTVNLWNYMWLTDEPSDMILRIKLL